MKWRTMWGALVFALVTGAAAAATPEEDFRDGEKAYFAGDVIGAMTTLRRAADKGHAPAQALLAEILDRAEFDEEALAWYRKAAEQGHAPAEFGLGAMYLAGEGVKADPGQAVFWFTRAAERGHSAAIVALAQALMNAPPERSADEATLLRWLQRAAELDYVPAMERLAAGGGEQAKYWSERAAEVKKRQAGTPPKKKRRS